VKGKVRDKDGWVTEYQDTMNIYNVAPIAAFNAPDSAVEGGNFTVSMSTPYDPSSADTAAGFTYAYDCNNDGQYNDTDSNGASASCRAGSPGTQTVKAKIFDKDGGTSTYSKDVTIVADDVAPSGTISINGGAAYTRSASVNLTLNASDPSPSSGIFGMQFSNDGINWSAVQGYNTTKSWTLVSGDGTKTVRVRYIDWAGNVSTFQDAIRLDTTRPTVTGMSPRPTSTITDTSPTIKATVKDNLTNLAKANIKLYVNDSLISATKYSYSASTDLLVYNSPVLAKGKKTVKVVATDAAGNVGAKSWYFTIK